MALSLFKKIKNTHTPDNSDCPIYSDNRYREKSIDKVTYFYYNSSMRDLWVTNILLNASGKERRVSIRYNVFAQCEIAELAFCIFTVHDVSEGGCQLQVQNFVSHNFEKGQMYTLNVSPHLLTNQQVSIEDFTVVAALIWIEQSDNMLRLGFQFSQSDSRLKQWLTFIIQNRSKKDIPRKRLI